jgi:hypothetical protein
MEGAFLDHDQWPDGSHGRLEAQPAQIQEQHLMTITRRPRKPAAAKATADAPAAPAKRRAKPAAKQAAAPEPATDATAHTIIEGAGQVKAAAVIEPVPTATLQEKAKKKNKGKDKTKDKDKHKKKAKKNKEAVLIRFENDQLSQIDGRADSLGLSRAAWVRMVVAQALSES